MNLEFINLTFLLNLSLSTCSLSKEFSDKRLLSVVATLLLWQPLSFLSSANETICLPDWSPVWNCWMYMRRIYYWKYKLFEQLHNFLYHNFYFVFEIWGPFTVLTILNYIYLQLTTLTSIFSQLPVLLRVVRCLVEVCEAKLLYPHSQQILCLRNFLEFHNLTKM